MFFLVLLHVVNQTKINIRHEKPIFQFGKNVSEKIYSGASDRIRIQSNRKEYDRFGDHRQHQYSLQSTHALSN